VTKDLVKRDNLNLAMRQRAFYSLSVSFCLCLFVFVFVFSPGEKRQLALGHEAEGGNDEDSKAGHPKSPTSVHL